MLRLYSTLHRAVVPFETTGRGQGRDVCVRADGAERASCRPRAIGCRLRCDPPLSDLEWPRRDLRAQRHRHRGQDHRGRCRGRGAASKSWPKRDAERFAAGYQALGVLAPDIEPKATEHIPEMIDLIASLIDRGLAYPSEGDVYFSVRADRGLREAVGPQPRRASLRRSDRGRRGEARSARLRPLEGGEAGRARAGTRRGARAVRAGTSSARPWRPSTWVKTSTSTAAAPTSSSPITRTRSPRARGPPAGPFARYWLHNGMVNLGGEKMAKSTGILVDLASITEKHGGRALAAPPPAGPLSVPDRILRRAPRRVGGRPRPAAALP